VGSSEREVQLGPQKIVPQKAAQPKEVRAYSPFVPLLLVIISLILMLGFQLAQLQREHSVLRQSSANVSSSITEAQKVRTQFKSIVKGTARLAAEGNQSATSLIQQLRSKGITVGPATSKKGVSP